MDRAHFDAQDLLEVVHNDIYEGYIIVIRRRAIFSNVARSDHIVPLLGLATRFTVIAGTLTVR